MRKSIFAVYFDPAEIDTLTDDPAYLRGVFSTHARAAAALSKLTGAGDDPRWLIVEEALDEVGWTDGFVTETTAKDEDSDE